MRLIKFFSEPIGFVITVVGFFAFFGIKGWLDTNVPEWQYLQYIAAAGFIAFLIWDYLTYRDQELECFEDNYTIQFLNPDGSEVEITRSQVLRARGPKIHSIRYQIIPDRNGEIGEVKVTMRSVNPNQVPTPLDGELFVFDQGPGAAKETFHWTKKPLPYEWYSPFRKNDFKFGAKLIATYSNCFLRDHEYFEVSTKDYDVAKVNCTVKFHESRPADSSVSIPNGSYAIRTRESSMRPEVLQTGNGREYTISVDRLRKGSSLRIYWRFSDEAEKLAG